MAEVVASMAGMAAVVGCLAALAPEGSLEASVAATEVEQSEAVVERLAAVAAVLRRTCRSSSTDSLAAHSSGLHSTE